MLCCVVFIQAQNQSTETVYLKNGSIIKGKVVEMIPDKQIKVKTTDGSLFVYTMDEIEKITKEEKRHSSFKTFTDDAYETSGFKGIVELGYVAGNFSAPEFSLSVGYQINPYFSIGPGAGIQYLIEAGIVAIPIFADLRGCLFLGKISPFVSLKMGYEKLIDVGYVDGGFYCNPSIGAKVMTTKRQAINFGLGLTTFSPKGWSKEMGTTFKLGYEF